MRGMGLKQAIAHGASKRMQVVARACQLDTDEHHRGLAHRTGGAAANWSEWKDGRQALRLGHDASPRNWRERNTLCHRHFAQSGTVIIHCAPFGANS
jgi:hypothetical protein